MVRQVREEIRGDKTGYWSVGRGGLESWELGNWSVDKVGWKRLGGGLVYVVLCYLASFRAFTLR